MSSILIAGSQYLRMTENPQAKQESPHPLSESAFYLFAAASELFSGSYTGQGAYIAEECSKRDIVPSDLFDALIGEEKYINRLYRMALNSHEGSTRPIPRIRPTDVKNAIKISFETADQFMHLPEKQLQTIKKLYWTFIKPFSSSVGLESLEERETRYREFVADLTRNDNDH